MIISRKIPVNNLTNNNSYTEEEKEINSELSNKFLFNCMLSFVKNVPKEKENNISGSGPRWRYASLESINTVIKKGMIDASSYILKEYGVRAWFSFKTENITHTNSIYSATLKVEIASTLEKDSYYEITSYSLECDKNEKRVGGLSIVQSSGSINTYINRYLKQNFFNLSCGEIDLDDIIQNNDSIQKNSNTKSIESNLINDNKILIREYAGGYNEYY